MPSLRPAHRGYAYQDLLVACRLVDVMLGSFEDVRVDEALVPNDRLDDLTTVDEAGRRERVQIKHTGKVDRALPISTFTGTSRGLHLSKLISNALADRANHEADAAALSFRVVLRDTVPKD